MLEGIDEVEECKYERDRRKKQVEHGYDREVQAR